MIDGKLLATYEKRVEAVMRESDYPIAIVVDNPAELIEIIRNARRYLALRNAAKTQEGRVKVQAIFWHMASRKDIDAAADRLLEGGE